MLPHVLLKSSEPQVVKLILEAEAGQSFTNPGCKDLEEDRGGKGSSTEERGGRKE